MPRSELLFRFEEGIFDKSEAKLSLTDIYYLLRLGAYENEQGKLLSVPIENSHSRAYDE